MNSSTNKEVMQEIKIMKDLIRNEIDEFQKDLTSLELKRTVNKLENAITYLEVYIYIIAVNQMHQKNSEFSKFELLSLLKESAENVRL